MIAAEYWFFCLSYSFYCIEWQGIKKMVQS
jgi:hypothetical protein